MNPYRQQPTPPSTREADEIDREIRKMAQKRRRLMVGMASGLVLLVAAPYLYMAYGMHKESVAEDDAKRAEMLDASSQKILDDVLARADAALAKQDADFRTATSKAALDAIDVGDGDCSDAPSAPTGQAADSYLKYGSIDVNYFGSASFTIVTGDDAGKASPVAHARDSIDRIRAANKDHSATKSDLSEANEIVGNHARGTTIFIRADDQQEPTITTSADYSEQGTFEPGFVRGRAYVYRSDIGRITCVGDIDAENSPTVDVRYFTTTINGAPITGSMAQLEAEKAGVKRDLELQIRRALSTELHDVAAAAPIGDDEN